MTKKETADFLGLTVKSLENHMAKKRIAFAHVKIKGVTQVEFIQEEVERFKEELGKKDKISFPAIAPGANNLAPTVPTAPSGNGDSMIISTNDLMTILKEISKGLNRPVQQLSVSIENRLMLSIEEIAALTSLPIGSIKGTIKKGELKTVKVGRAPGQAHYKILNFNDFREVKRI